MKIGVENASMIDSVYSITPSVSSIGIFPIPLNLNLKII